MQEHSLVTKFAYWPVYCLLVGRFKLVALMLLMSLCVFGTAYMLSEVILEQVVIALEGYELTEEQSEKVQALVVLFIFVCGIPVMLSATTVCSSVVWFRAPFSINVILSETFKRLPLFVKGSVSAIQAGVYLAIGPSAIVMLYVLFVRGRFNQELEVLFMVVSSLVLLFFAYRSLILLMIPLVAVCGGIEARAAASIVHNTLSGARNVIGLGVGASVFIASALSAGIYFLPLDIEARVIAMLCVWALSTWYTTTALSFLAAEAVAIFRKLQEEQMQAPVTHQQSVNVQAINVQPAH